MKNSDKFWIVIGIIVFIVAQFDKDFRFGEFIIICIFLAVYSIFCFCQLWLYILGLENIEKDFLKINVLYWIVYLPIIKFNKFLNNL